MDSPAITVFCCCQEHTNGVFNVVTHANCTTRIHLAHSSSIRSIKQRSLPFSCTFCPSIPINIFLTYQLFLFFRKLRQLTSVRALPLSHNFAGIPQGMLEFSNTNTSVLLVELKVYAMQSILFMGPLAAFVILSTLYCSFWSCGMMKCCAE